MGGLNTPTVPSPPTPPPRGAPWPTPRCARAACFWRAGPARSGTTVSRRSCLRMGVLVRLRGCTRGRCIMGVMLRRIRRGGSGARSSTPSARVSKSPATTKAVPGTPAASTPSAPTPPPNPRPRTSATTGASAGPPGSTTARPILAAHTRTTARRISGASCTRTSAWGLCGRIIQTGAGGTIVGSGVLRSSRRISVSLRGPC
mmetsp:Transcript_10311/g.26205  ORF Transcript_10311/g.26205 Transcript_10311/m.26205 type:complete len:202 (-) Transcript_10311:324-929(-)